MRHNKLGRALKKNGHTYAQGSFTKIGSGVLPHTFFLLGYVGGSSVGKAKERQSAIRRDFGALLVSFWKNLGTILAHLSPICPILGLSWELFGANLGLSWAPRGHLDPSWGLLGTKSFLEHPALKSL